MDVVLHYSDRFILTPYVYPVNWGPDDPFRQIISLFVITNISAGILYMGFASLSYFLLFDHETMKHPQFLNDQVRKEIHHSLSSIPLISIPTVLLFLLEVRGYSQLYDSFDNSFSGWMKEGFSIIAFLLFTDMMIYWIHRLLHHRLIYKRFHKPHHVWKVTTPFASHAFHPLDGFLQSLPYHLYVFLFPLQKHVYLTLYFVVNIWSISIHDSDYRVPEKLAPVVNGSAHHSVHHLCFDYNYGQYFTLWDRIGGSYRDPYPYLKNKIK